MKRGGEGWCKEGKKGVGREGGCGEDREGVGKRGRVWGGAGEEREDEGGKWVKAEEMQGVSWVRRNGGRK